MSEEKFSFPTADDSLSAALDNPAGQDPAFAHEARELGAHWVDELRTTVREHPLAALGIAWAAGMLLARMRR